MLVVVPVLVAVPVLVVVEVAVTLFAPISISEGEVSLAIGAPAPEDEELPV